MTLIEGLLLFEIDIRQINRLLLRNKTKITWATQSTCEGRRIQTEGIYTVFLELRYLITTEPKLLRFMSHVSSGSLSHDDRKDVMIFRSFMWLFSLLMNVFSCVCIAISGQLISNLVCTRFKIANVQVSV